MDKMRTEDDETWEIVDVPEHADRFTDETVPTQLVRNEIIDNDLIVRLNDGERAIRFAVTITRAEKQVIFNKVVDYRWNRHS